MLSLLPVVVTAGAVLEATKLALILVLCTAFLYKLCICIPLRVLECSLEPYMELSFAFHVPVSSQWAKGNGSALTTITRPNAKLAVSRTHLRALSAATRIISASCTWRRGRAHRSAISQTSPLTFRLDAPLKLSPSNAYLARFGWSRIGTPRNILLNRACSLWNISSLVPACSFLWICNEILRFRAYRPLNIVA